MFLRPEKISLTSTTENPSTTSRQGSVANIVYLGNQAAFTVDLGDGIEMMAQARPREDGNLPFVVGETISVEFSSRALRVLAK